MSAAIVATAREIFADRYGDEPHGIAGGACLYWAVSAIIAAHMHGRRLVLNAGSAQFRRLPDHLDDGKPDTLTHFAYEWTPPHMDPLRVPVVDGERVPPHLTTRPDPHGRMRRCLPEIHVWAGDPATQELVDLSTFALKRQCETTGRMPWLEAEPPDHVWCHVSEIPDGWHYVPSAEATAHAIILASMYA